MTSFVTVKRFEVALILFGVLILLDISTLVAMYIFTGIELTLVMLGGLLCMLTLVAFAVLIVMGLFLKRTDQF